MADTRVEPETAGGCYCSMLSTVLVLTWRSPVGGPGLGTVAQNS